MKKRKQQQPVPTVAAAPVAPLPASTSVAASLASYDEPEPVAGRGAIPIPIIGLLGLMLFIADTYIMNYGADIGGKGGSFPNSVYYPPFKNFIELDSANPKSPAELLMAQGRQAYMMNCAPCHQPNGAGNPAQNIPPLAGSEWVGAAGPGRAIRIVLNSVKGPITVKGQTFDNPSMPPWRATLSDEQIASILTFVRGNKEWGNSAGPVLPDQVKKIRDATASKTDQWTAAELQQISDNE